MKKILVLILIAMLSLPALASEESKRKNVESILELTHSDKMMDMVYAQMQNMASQYRQQNKISNEDSAAYEIAINKIFSRIKENFSWDKLKEPIIEVYVKNYTEKEIEDIKSFYQSESGQSMINKMPAVMADTMKITMGMMQENIPKMDELVNEIQAEMALAKHEQQATP